MAKFNNGVLDMIIHKAEESKGKKISIKRVIASGDSHKKVIGCG